MDEHRLMDDEEGGEHNDPYSVDGHDGLGANSAFYVSHNPIYNTIRIYVS